MMKKVVKKLTVEQAASPSRDLAYWLSRPAEERLAAVEYLRKQLHGDSTKMQKIVRVVKRRQKER